MMLDIDEYAVFGCGFEEELMVSQGLDGGFSD